MRRLRLLVVGSSWPPQTFLGRLMRGLAASGVDVRIAFSREPDQEWFHAAGLKSLRTRDWTGMRWLRLLSILWQVLRGLARSPRDLGLYVRHALRERSLRNRLRTLNRLLPFAGIPCDVIYFPWNSGAVAYLPLFEQGPPVVVSCRGSQVNVAPHDPLRKIREGLPDTFARAAAVHCVSAAIQREAERYGLDPGKARVIHPGIDPGFFSPLGSRREDGVLEIITVGSLVWVKGTTHALEAVRQLVAEGIRLRFSIVGDGPERQRVLYTIDDLGLGEHVRLLGRLPPIAVRDALREADIFVLPSLSEGFSNAAVEAMACELPVVMTNCGGVIEGVTDGVEGLVVPVRDPAALALAISKLARDPELRLRMGRAGRTRVLTQFTLARHVREFRELLEEARRWRAA